ncbi:MAG: hypothetical protein BWX45_00885 [Deltaproteobacteria bacterium ADurb.Bin002]|nr:MAG: hypothetical protein BWX45_00885 [Deltaproteobacteria bacterium ADurb.Bin002]
MHIGRRGVDDDVGHLPQGRQLFCFRLNAFHDGTLFGQRMAAPRLAETAQQRLFSGFQKQYFDPVSLFLQAFKDALVLFQKAFLPQIHDQRHLFDLRRRLEGDGEELRQQHNREIVHAKEADVFQRPERGAFSGTGQSRDDHHLEIFQLSDLVQLLYGSP